MRCIVSQTFQKLHQDDCNIGSVTQEDQEEEGNSSSWDWGETKCDELLQQEVKLQHQAELEADERKLAEALELQRRAEEEAREQHLAEQCWKKLTQDSHVQKGTSEDDGCGVIESFCSLSAKSSTIAPEFFHPEPSDTHTEGCLLLPEMKPRSFFDLSPPADTLTDELTISSIALQSSRSCSYAQSIIGTADAGDVIVMSPQQLQIEMETSEADDNHSADPSIGLMRSVSRVDPEAHQRVDLVEKVGCLEGLSPESNKLDGNQPTGLAKKSRHRRKRGPRIHAEEGMMGDQEGQAVLDVNASSPGLKFLHGQSENKAPLSLPTSGSHPLPLMLLPAPASTAEGGFN